MARLLKRVLKDLEDFLEVIIDELVYVDRPSFTWLFNREHLFSPVQHLRHLSRGQVEISGGPFFLDKQFGRFLEEPFGLIFGLIQGVENWTSLQDLTECWNF